MTTKIEIEILEDGKISVTTGEVGQAEHVSADEFLDLIMAKAGGVRVTTKRDHPFWDKRDVKLHGKIVAKA
jgi:hypothetical protein